MDKIIVLFSHGNLAVEMLSNIVSTVQDSTNAVSANTFFWVEINT